MSDERDARAARRAAARRRMRLLRALPSPGEALAGSIAWAVAMAASAGFGLMRRGWSDPAALLPVVAIFAIGGLLAYAPALTVIRHGGPRRFEAGLAVAILVLCTATILFTAGAYALHYRLYYAEFHADPLSVPWFFQFAFTVLGAFYQFASGGLALYVPIGLAALFVAAAIEARRAR